jgi:GT2 family glycosyltransferase
MSSFYETLKYINRIIVDGVIRNLKVGLAISTYLRSNNDNRLNAIKKSMDSLNKTNWPSMYKIYVVDDKSESKEHINFIKNNGYSYEIYERQNNGGIAKCKNTCIRLLYESDCDFLILADDDVYYNDPNWIKEYLYTILNTNVKYLSFYIYSQSKTIKINDNPINITESLNGCFIIFEREVVDTVGYFQVMPYKYGHEHTDYTIRIKKRYGISYFVDVGQSKKLIETELGYKSITQEEANIWSSGNQNYINRANKYYPNIE